jgi:4,5-DOPA dioxygenase extradiol
VLCHVFPNADIPVVQLSIDARLSPSEHVELGKMLAPLRDEGVFVVGSGNVVHHLGRISWGREGFGEPWAIEFDQAVKDLAEGGNPGRVIEALDRPDANLSVPTPEHFLPVAYIAGLAEAEGAPLRTFVAGCEMGSLSMRSFVLAA